MSCARRPIVARALALASVPREGIVTRWSQARTPPERMRSEISPSRSRSSWRSASTAEDSTDAVRIDGEMGDMLIVADTRSSPEMRHEVPLVVPDPFLYAEVGGKRHAVTASFERTRIDELGLGIEVVPYEELGIDELSKKGLRPHEI